ncbi:MAG TPA: hypothetical protein VLH08_10555 [Acidobacteriota bacterium]|nr:hypothetical protein [Acidobacteriota bacterium]
MVWISKYTSIQSTNVDLTANTEATKPAVTSNSPTEQAASTPTVANSANTWQRAGLLQDGRTQQSLLYDQLTAHKSYQQASKEIEQNKEAKESNSGALFGTIFGGPVIGTLIGQGIETEASHKEQNPLRDLLGQMESEVKQMEEQLKKMQDDAFIETVGGFFGYDKGQTEIAQATNQNPAWDLPKEASTKVSYDGDDD